jgi:hypothetical protein
MGAALLGAGCGSAPAPRPPDTIVWHQVGSWSGRGNAQTESFTSDTGSIRVRWETRNEDAKDEGTLRLTLQSAVSGRPLAVAVDARGVGRGEAIVPESPRPVYILIESTSLDWSFAVDEVLVGAGS